MNVEIKNAVITGDTAAFFSLVRSPLKFRLFLLRKLPSAFFAGVRVRHIDDNRCEVIVPYKWFSKNPFHSTYFACLSMAAEMSTGVLAMGHCYKMKPPVSMLVIKIEGEFIKKAVGNTRFTCEQGMEIKEMIRHAMDSGEPKIIRVKSIGRNKDAETVAIFYVTWSFKKKISMTNEPASLKATDGRSND